LIELKKKVEEKKVEEKVEQVIKGEEIKKIEEEMKNLEEEQNLKPLLEEPKESCVSVEGENNNCKAKRVFKFIGMILFLALPALHFWSFPYGFPFFLYPCGLILAIVGICKLKKRREFLEERGIYGLSIHVLLFSIINGIFVWSNLWGGGFPWSIVTLAIGGLFVALHALKTKFKESKYNDKFYIHSLFFGVFAFVVLVLYIFGNCHPGNHHHWGHHRQLESSKWT